MKAIINFGNPRKDMKFVADAVLSKHSQSQLKITGLETYESNGILLSSAAYGAGMTFDALYELKNTGLIERGDAVIFVGSMGSLCEEEITLGDVVIPHPVCCAYYGFDGLSLWPDRPLLEFVEEALANSGISYREYKHGSSFAVFDPHTDQETYNSSLYANDVIGVDCGEVFLGLHFAQLNEIRAAAVLYCSDSPKTHIADIGIDEFNRRATDWDTLLNNIAAQALRLGF